MIVSKKGWLTSWSAVLGLCLFLSGEVVGQSRQTKSDAERPSSCDQLTVSLEDSIAEAQKDADPSSSMIVIFRLGRNENKPALNTSRIAEFRASIEIRRPVLNYVLASTSVRASGLGTGEIYIRGRLTHVLYFPNNSKRICSP